MRDHATEKMGYRLAVLAAYIGEITISHNNNCLKRGDRRIWLSGNNVARTYIDRV